MKEIFCKPNYTSFFSYIIDIAAQMHLDSAFPFSKVWK